MPCKPMSETLVRQAREAVEKYGSIAAAARRLRIPRKTLANRYHGGSRGIGAKTVSPDAVEQNADIQGITLRTARVACQKPVTNDVKRRIYRLEKGKGFPVGVLSEAWNVSEECIIRHAKRLDAFRYVEVGPEQWEQCIIHPDTKTNEEKGIE